MVVGQAGVKTLLVDDHPIVQCDVASLEDGRGSAVRSTILEIYRDGTFGLFFRNHTSGTWEESLLLAAPVSLAPGS